MALMYMFTLGCAMILARMCSAAPDLTNLVPIGTNLLRFTSGVFYSISMMADRVSVDYPWLGWFLHYQPFALYLKLARAGLMTPPAKADAATLATLTVSGAEWAWAIGWAVFFLVFGFIYFWFAEARYGRE
jgi:teichoic acid transport system permease protein